MTEMGLKLRGERLPSPLGIRFESPKYKGALGLSEVMSILIDDLVKCLLIICSFFPRNVFPSLTEDWTKLLGVRSLL